MTTNQIWLQVDDNGEESVHVLWGEHVYTGRRAGNAFLFSDRLPSGVCDLLHEWFGKPKQRTDYTLGA